LGCRCFNANAAHFPQVIPKHNGNSSTTVCRETIDLSDAYQIETVV
jgi:hypothetical protein